ncbi:S-layer homology domain-containing protein [Clostridia bacterium]|nr:S-layer homology domain-containing protein [Clostridia bacterium]
MQKNKWLPIPIATAIFLFVIPMFAPAYAAGNWSQPYVQEMQRIGYLTDETSISESEDIPRGSFFKMLSAYSRDLRNGMAQDLAEQKKRKYIDDWILKEKKSEDTISRMEALQAIARVKDPLLPEALNEKIGYSDCEMLSEENQLLVDYFSKEHQIQGYPDGTFRPQKMLNYAEACCLFFQSLYVDKDERAINMLETIDLATLVEPEAFGRSSQWAWSVFPRPGKKDTFLFDLKYPVDLGRLRVLRAPVLYTSESGRRWILLEMEYAKHCPKGFDVYLISGGGERFLRRSNFEEYFLLQDDRVKIYYPLVSKYDSFTLNDEGQLEYHFEDCDWASYDGQDIDYLLLFDPLFGQWLVLPWTPADAS